MAQPALDHTYRYPFASRLANRGRHLSLATSGGNHAHPDFFVGLLRQPRHAADMMLTLGLVARSRFVLPPAMLARILAAADPVVTSDGQRLRMESFSACCGVYARADLLAVAVDGQWQGRGTTNVDFNQPLRAALARLGQADELRLSVGPGQLEVETPEGSMVERKVPLPVRWLKGFVAVQAFSARMTLRHEVNAAEARRFLRSLPRQRSRGDFWVVSAGRGLRLSQRRGRDGAQVGGLERLSVLDNLARHARSLRVYGREDGQARRPAWRARCSVWRPRSRLRRTCRPRRPRPWSCGWPAPKMPEATHRPEARAVLCSRHLH